MSTAEKYFAAGYVVALLTVMAYVLIIALELTRLEREVGELELLVAARAPEQIAASGRKPEAATESGGVAAGGAMPPPA